MLERRSDEVLVAILEKVAAKVKVGYAARACVTPFTTERVLAAGQDFLFHLRKPVGVSCYYLVLFLVHTRLLMNALFILRRLWELHGTRRFSCILMLWRDSCT